jgi:hypothetical protein
VFDLAGDAGPEHGTARLALKRHDPVVHGYGEPRRVGEEPVRDHVLGDLAADLLHDHTADRIARRVSRVPGAAATIIPFDVWHKVETIHARRVRAAAHREPDPPAGADPIGSLRQRGRATVQGRLHAAEVRPGRPDSNVLACEVADSTGELTAVFYGRTQIAGLEPGRRVQLHGMVGIGADGRPAMINPAYDLLA